MNQDTSHLGRFVQRPVADKLLFLKATFLVGLVRLGLSLTSFATVSKLLERLQRRQQRKAADAAFDHRATWAVSKASRLIQNDKPCLTQALVLQLMLHRKGRPADLVIGVAKNEDQSLKAHAWIEQNGRVLIGGASSPKRYTPLASIDDYRS